MKTTEHIRDVGRLLGMIQNGLHRKHEKNPLFREVDGMTGKNGWIIGYLAHNQDHPVYPEHPALQKQHSFPFPTTLTA